MTTYIPFTPSATAPFQFQPILDDQVYNVIITWNLFGQRYYVNVYDTSGSLIVTLPMIASPLANDISIVAGYFTSSLIWRAANNWFEVFP